MASRRSQFDMKDSVSGKLDEHWKGRKATLERFKVKLPDITESIDPSLHEYHVVINKWKRFDRERNGISANSLKMLATCIRTWDSYCAENGVYSIPVNTEFFMSFLMQKVSEGKSVNTIKQYYAQLSYFFGLFEDTTPLHGREVRGFLKSLINDEADISGYMVQPKQASAFRKHDFDRLVGIVDKTNLRQRRDLALVSVAYATMLREGELGRIRKKHITVHSDRKVTISRVRSKTSSTVKPKLIQEQFAEVFLLFYQPFSQQLSEDDFIFSHMSRSGKALNPTVPCSGRAVDSAFQRLYNLLLQDGHKFASLCERPWSGHSGRVGGVQDGYLIKNLSITQLMQSGDWTSVQMPMRYLRNIDTEDLATVSLQLS
ncbi:tyrosine-type recombinase/integrase [Vibrio sp. S4M6]|uniref:tyrosine-type recombinase/integrase n=1 Tax=Vibrio sinus TaxID=2946865 RepID=UPI00202A9A55|nr:tyrosine-type recombinase/integrase [Vibrio sinus]MCL9779815.1 tyrosine-type recombinase/integrase [Vibrio sinus]